jgi:hypothetical protein
MRVPVGLLKTPQDEEHGHTLGIRSVHFKRVPVFVIATVLCAIATRCSCCLPQVLEHPRCHVVVDTRHVAPEVHVVLKGRGREGKVEAKPREGDIPETALENVVCKCKKEM